MSRQLDSNEEGALRPAERERLDAWLEAARSADVPSFEETAGDASPERRAAHVRRLAESIAGAADQKAKVAKRRARLPWYAFAAAACFALVATAGVVGLSSGEDEPASVAAVKAGANLRQVVGTVIAVHPNGQNQIVDADAIVAAGDEISTTAEGFASLEAGNARVDLSSATTVALEELEQESQTFHLHAGRVDLSVPKVPGTKRTVKVRTSDALVTVYGTVFSVEVAKRDGKEVTSVGVSRGLVSVDHQGAHIMLPAGTQWSSLDGISGKTAENPAPQPQPEVAEEPKPSRRPRWKPRASSMTKARETQTDESPDGTSVGTADSDLAEQNRLFERAMRERDAGNDEQAIGRLQQLLTEYPSSPLRSTAQAELRAALKRQRDAK